MTDRMDISLSPDSSGDIVTPKEQQIADPSALSPPDSQQRSMPISASGASLANSNGKRPIQTISNGNDDLDEITSMGNGSLGGSSRVNSTKSHPSGYTWTSAEDEPGYMWQSKKAQDEYKRAADHLVHTESSIRAQFGDLFEMVENEKAVLASMEQR